MTMANDTGPGYTDHFCEEFLQDLLTEARNGFASDAAVASDVRLRAEGVR